MPTEVEVVTGGHPLVTKAHLLAGEAAGSVTEAEVVILIHLSTTEGAAEGRLLGGGVDLGRS